MSFWLTTNVDRSFYLSPKPFSLGRCSTESRRLTGRSERLRWLCVAVGLLGWYVGLLGWYLDPKVCKTMAVYACLKGRNWMSLGARKFDYRFDPVAINLRSSQCAANAKPTHYQPETYLTPVLNLPSTNLAPAVRQPQYISPTPTKPILNPKPAVDQS